MMFRTFDLMLPVVSIVGKLAQSSGKKLISQLGVSPNGHLFLSLGEEASAMVRISFSHPENGTQRGNRNKPTNMKHEKAMEC